MDVMEINKLRLRGVNRTVELVVLMSIPPEGTILSRLCESLEIESGHLTRVITRLEALGLVEGVREGRYKIVKLVKNTCDK